MRFLLFTLALTFAPAAHAATLDDLSWIKGCWRMTNGGTVVTEVWSAPPMPALLGYAYTTRDGVLREWEQTRITVIDGAPTYVAMPMGAPQTLFRLRDDSPRGTARFYNAEHDFPNTVEYRREGDWLYASVYADHSEHRQEFRYRRIRCESALRP